MSGFAPYAVASAISKSQQVCCTVELKSGCCESKADQQGDSCCKPLKLQKTPTETATAPSIFTPDFDAPAIRPSAAIEIVVPIYRPHFYRYDASRAPPNEVFQRSVRPRGPPVF
jgi:hypothetical protein